MTTILLLNLIAAVIAVGLVAYVISLPLRRLTNQPVPSARLADSSRENASWEHAA